MPLNPGDTLLNGHYRIEGLLGRGGFGFVYRAVDVELGTVVAIKELIPALVGDEEVMKRFLAEARATMRLTHEHIVRTHHIFREAGSHYIVMEFMPGGSLEDCLRRLAPAGLPVDEAVRIAAQVCEALAYAHERGVVHCDLKPANILCAADPSGSGGMSGTVKVADFGIAHVSGEMLTRSWHTPAGFVAGTLPYMSPEQVAGVRDNPRIDVYALGAILFRLLTGRTYLDFEHRETPLAQAENVLRIRSEPPQAPSRYNPRVPAGLDQVVLRALAKRPEDRPAGAAALRAALLQSPALGAQPAARPAPQPLAPTQPIPAGDTPARDAYESPPPAQAARPAAEPTRPPIAPQPGRAETPAPRQAGAGAVARPAGEEAAPRRKVPGWVWTAAGLAAAALVVLGLVLALALSGRGGRATEEPRASTRAPEPTPAVGLLPPEPPRQEPTPLMPVEPVVPPGPYEGVDPSGQTVLWWHQNARERQEGLDQMVEEFNASNEWGIRVAPEYAGGYAEIYDKMITAIAADDPTLMPNLTVGYANQVAKYQLSGALVDMDEFVDSSRWGLTPGQRADFFSGIFQSDVSPIFGDGHFRMGFPPNRSMEVLYYNLDWLHDLGYDGPPTTWAEFEELACAATDPAAGTVGYEISTDASRFASMVFSRHGNYFLEDGSSFDFENDVVIETMAYIKRLFDKGCATLIAEAYGDQTDFGNYKTLFTIGSSSGLPYYDQAVKSGGYGEFEWGVGPLPYRDGGDRPVMNIYGASVSIPVTTPEQELAAWLFVRWFTAPEQNARWAQISQYFPVREGAAALMLEYFAQDPKYKDAFDLLQYGTYEAQWCACYEEVRRQMEDAYIRILDGADIGQTLGDLQHAANVSLAENTPASMSRDLLDEIRARGRMVVSTDPAFPPQSFLNEAGQYEGFDIDVARQVAARIGVDLEFIDPDWSNIIGGNWGGRWDISIGSMTPTESRAQALWFTEPYYFAPESHEPAVFALDKSRGPSDRLIALLNKIIADMRADGSLSELSIKWYGRDLTMVVEP